MKKLNKDIQEKAKLLHTWLLEQEVVKEYQKYEQLIHQDQTLHDLENKLKLMQQRIVQEKSQGNQCDQLIEEYQVCKKSFDTHPLIVNYLALKEEVNSLVLSLQDDINQQLKKIVD